MTDQFDAAAVFEQPVTFEQAVTFDSTVTITGATTLTAGINVTHSTDDVSATPTDAELDTAFGTATAVGAGFVATLDDNGAGTASWLVWSDGTNWFFAAGTKAT